MPDVTGNVRVLSPSGSKEPREPSLPPTQEEKDARRRSRSGSKMGDRYSRGGSSEKEPVSDDVAERQGRGIKRR